MGNTITGAASGETGFSGAEGFTISGKRTEDDHELLFQDSFCSAEIGEANLFFYILLEENVSRGMILTGERAESHCFSSVSDLIGFYSAPFCAFLPELQANQANRRRPGTRGQILRRNIIFSTQQKRHPFTGNKKDKRGGEN